MRTAGQPAHYVFCANDRQCVGLRGPVDRRADEGAARLQEPATGGQKTSRIREVLDDFEREHHIEATAAARQRLGSRSSIGDLEASGLAMGSGARDRLATRVDRGNL